MPSKPAPTALAEKARRANIANILKRLNAGQTLSKSERLALDEHEASEVAKNGRRLLKMDLARELGISRVTLDGYLNRKTPPPPKPDDKRRYSVDEVAKYIADNSTKAVSSEEMRKLRERMLSIQVEREHLELETLRGRYIPKGEIEPAIAAFVGQLTEDLRLKFEMELPAKYSGRTVIERQKLNADGIDWVLRRLKSGAEKVTAKS